MLKLFLNLLVYFLLDPRSSLANTQNGSDIENNNFLSELFHVGMSEIVSIAKNFKFVTASPETIHFFVFTFSGQFHEINYENATDAIDLDKATKFIIHGWQSNSTMDFVVEMAAMYHNKTNYNIIAVDWKKIAEQNYIYSANAVKYVGEYIGDFIVNITRTCASFIDRTHLIGHSLGSHVSGFAGKRVFERLNKHITRITGLDAAGPLFEIPLPRPPNFRLDKSDATFVDLLHTNIGYYGVRFRYGHVDVYINGGGPIQPHCANDSNPNFCSHMSAPTYQTKSVENPTKFYSIPCPMDLLYSLHFCDANKKTIMGEFAVTNVSGLYFLKLNLNKVETGNETATIIF